MVCKKTFKFIMVWFKKKTLAEKYPPKDDFQQKYRESFGGIVDKYLIYFCEDDDENMVIFIDAENDVDWIVKKDPLTSDEDQKKKMEYLARLDVAQASPCLNLSERNIMKFKIMLGAGYEAALHGNFDVVQPTIDQALKFLKDRNKEQGRFLMLIDSTIIILVGLGMVGFTGLWKNDWVDGCALGVLGAYVSVWSRSGNTNLSGLSSTCIYLLEAFARLFCGAIFAFMAMLLLDTGLVLKDCADNWAYHCIIGFIAGFNERFVPSIIEKVTSETNNEEENIHE